MMTTTPGADRLRFRRLIYFLRHRRLYATARSLERETGVFFDAPHLRRILLRDRWAAASSYALRFLHLRGCSREAATLHRYFIVCRVIAELATGHTLTRAGDARFHQLYDSALATPNCHATRRSLLSWRSDHTKASRLYHNTKPKVVHNIMHLVANCPELKPKLSRLPHYSTSNAPLRLWGCTTRHNNKHAHIPPHVMAASFLRKRSSPMSQKAHHSNSALLPFFMDQSATLSSNSPRKKAGTDGEPAVEAVSQLVEVDDRVQHPKTVESESADQLRCKRASRPNPKYYGPEWRSKQVCPMMKAGEMSG